MGEALLVRVIEAAERAVADRAAELDALDAAIGDGDHGTNLARGLAALSARRHELAAMRLPEALAAAGEILAAETGGDGGRCYGALLGGMAEAAGAASGPQRLARMVQAGVAAVKAAGGGAYGEKTMLDVLEPVARVLGGELAEGRVAGVGSRALAAAAHGLHRTSRLVAARGQAAGLGAASVNHLDPGAWSAALIVGAAIGVLEAELPRR